MPSLRARFLAVLFLSIVFSACSSGTSVTPSGNAVLPNGFTQTAAPTIAQPPVAPTQAAIAGEASSEGAASIEQGDAVTLWRGRRDDGIAARPKILHFTSSKEKSRPVTVTVREATTIYAGSKDVQIASVSPLVQKVSRAGSFEYDITPKRNDSETHICFLTREWRFTCIEVTIGNAIPAPTSTPVPSTSPSPSAPPTDPAYYASLFSPPPPVVPTGGVAASPLPAPTGSAIDAYLAGGAALTSALAGELSDLSIPAQTTGVPAATIGTITNVTTTGFTIAPESFDLDGGTASPDTLFVKQYPATTLTAVQVSLNAATQFPFGSKSQLAPGAFAIVGGAPVASGLNASTIYVFPKAALVGQNRSLTALMGSNFRIRAASAARAAASPSDTSAQSITFASKTGIPGINYDTGKMEVASIACFAKTTTFYADLQLIAGFGSQGSFPATFNDQATGLQVGSAGTLSLLVSSGNATFNYESGLTAGVSFTMSLCGQQPVNIGALVIEKGQAARLAALTPLESTETITSKGPQACSSYDLGTGLIPFLKLSAFELQFCPTISIQGSEISLLALLESGYSGPGPFMLGDQTPAKIPVTLDAATDSLDLSEFVYGPLRKKATQLNVIVVGQTVGSFTIPATPNDTIALKTTYTPISLALPVTAASAAPLTGTYQGVEIPQSEPDEGCVDTWVLTQGGNVVTGAVAVQDGCGNTDYTKHSGTFSGTLANQQLIGTVVYNNGVTGSASLTVIGNSQALSGDELDTDGTDYDVELSLAGSSAARKGRKVKLYRAHQPHAAVTPGIPGRGSPQ